MGRVQGRQGRHNFKADVVLRSAATADRMLWGGPPPPQGNAVVGYGVGRSGRPAVPRRPQARSRLIAQGKGVPRKPGRGPQAGKKGPTRRNEPEPRRARSGWGIRPGTAKHAPTHASHRAVLKRLVSARPAPRSSWFGTCDRLTAPMRSGRCCGAEAVPESHRAQGLG